MNLSQKTYYGYLEGWISIILNTLLFFIKIWAGSVNNSIAMTADAWHTLSDSLTSVVVIIGFFISSRPADQEHPFGHGRTEFIASIVIGVLLGVVGFDFLIESVKKLLNHEIVFKFSLAAVIIFSISIIIKELLAQIAFHIGKKIDSSSVKADGWHHRSDAIASALIVIGALLGKRLWWIDSALGIAVSILIIKTAIDIIRGSSNTLLGENIDKKFEDNIKNEIKKIEKKIFNIHHMHLHKYGSHSELTVHICLPPDMNNYDSHEITKKIEKRLKRKFQLETTVHVEPSD
ncbi:MAG: cation transporter [Spirochaetes bacterium]|nr:cation transporter [Spirochaetota bacterium]